MHARRPSRTSRRMQPKPIVHAIRPNHKSCRIPFSPVPRTSLGQIVVFQVQLAVLLPVFNPTTW